MNLNLYAIENEYLRGIIMKKYKNEKKASGLLPPPDNDSDGCGASSLEEGEREDEGTGWSDHTRRRGWLPRGGCRITRPRGEAGRGLGLVAGTRAR